jgi:iron complex outermembrane receptor protein
MFKKTKVSTALLAAFGGLAFVGQQAQAQAQAPQQQLERVEITGSAVRRIQAETSLPVQIIKREDIERSGATSVTDLIQQLPSMQNFTNEGTSVGGGGAGFAGASIHNLGETRTLVLFNGRRLAPFAGQTLTGALAGIDLNTIPLASIERVEILTDGASALYGADAVGGVINFITRRNYQEGNITVGASSPKGGAQEGRVSISKGFGDLDKDRFNVMLGLNLEKRNKLDSVDREFAKTGVINFDLNGRNVTFFNGSPRGIPGNVTHDNGTPADENDDYLVNPYLVANGACPVKHVQLEQACYYDYTSDLEIYPERERAAFVAQATFKLSDNHSLFAELLTSKTKNTNRIAPPPGELLVGPSSPFWNYVLTANPGATVPAVIPYRASDVGKRSTQDTSEAQHIVFGAEGLLAGWDYNASFTHSVNKYDSTLTGGWVKLNAFFAALDSGLVNPFVLPGNQSAAAMEALNSSQILGFWEGGKSTLDTLQVRGSRELFDLPGGKLALATGASYMKEKFTKTASSLAQGQGDTRFGDTAAIIPYGANRDSTGLFAEVVAPVLKGLELTGSVRHDKYSDFGGASTAKLAARYQPTQMLLLRGSIGTGFKAPTVPQVNATEQEYGVTSGNYTCNADLAQIASDLGAACPAGNVQYNVRAGGNPNLQPEKSKQWTLGFRVEPTSDISIGADLWEVHLRNEISQIDESTVFADPLRWRSQFTTYVDPGTGQRLLALLSDNRNLGDRIERGIDFDARARFATPLGRVTTQLGLTYWIKDEYQFEPGGPFFTSLGQFGPDGAVTFRWQGKLQTTLQAGAWAHTLGINFKSGYKDQSYTAADFAVFDPVTFDSFDYNGTVKRYVSVDWQTSWDVRKNLNLTAGILNVFDKDPPRSLKSAGGGQMIGYDDRYYDPRGRTLYANLSFKF